MRKILFLFLLVFSLSACLPEAQYPPEPVISFKSLVPNSNQAVMRIDFTDGDGNIGLNQGDTLGINCPDTCRYYYNLFCEYYELQNGEWVNIVLDPEIGQIPFYYRLPYATPEGQNPALNGEIKIDMPSYYLIGTGFDTCRFEIQLVDRALNESNIVQSNIFIKPN